MMEVVLVVVMVVVGKVLLLLCHGDRYHQWAGDAIRACS